jgi:hypothetical protein
VKNLFRKGSANQAEAHLNQLRIFADGVHEAGSKASEDYRDQFVELETRFRERIQTMEKRIAVRERWILPRVVAACSLFLRGGYRNANGLRSVIRDIVGQW